MRTQNLLKANNNRLKKSHTLLIGSFLIFVGFISLTWNYLIRMKDEVYSDMRIAMMDGSLEELNRSDGETVENVPEVENVPASENQEHYIVDYSKYLGVLEIPRIGLKRGFYNVGYRYNDIRYNVTMIEGSTLPDVPQGNLILMAHSGDAYYSYFSKLWQLAIGDHAYVTYAGHKYEYEIVDIYQVEKNGFVVIRRNEELASLTMITCTKGNDFSQTVYVAELIG